MKPGDRVVLELTDEQAVVLERAVELLFRLHIGQFNEIKFALLQHVHDTGENVDLHCMMCEKTDKESKRCPVRRNIEALYMYDFPERKGCPIAHMNIDGKT